MKKRDRNRLGIVLSGEPQSTREKMRSGGLLLRFAICALLILASEGCVSNTPPRSVAAAENVPHDVLSYTIRPIPRHDRTVLQITLRFRGDTDGETVLDLPQDRYGTPDVHEAVASVQGIGETLVEPAPLAHQRIVRHPRSAMAELVYEIAWDPERSRGYAYSPSVSGGHFHFMGPQWIAWPQHSLDSTDLIVSFVDLPDGWTVLSSFGIGAGPHTMRAIVLDNLASFIAGGRYRTHDFECQKRPVRVGVTGNFELSDEIIFDDTEKVVCTERDWMDDHDPPFYTVSLTPREGIRAGTAVSNAFVALTDPGISRRRLDILLAHEMFHYWLPGRARVVGADFDEDVWASKWGYQWIDEGFTEYFARKILHEVGLLSLDEMVALTNEDIEDYWKNVHRDIPYAELRKAAEEGRFMSTHQRVGYFRGTLIALDWDTRIRHSTAGRRSLSDAIREIVDAGTVRGGHLPAQELDAIMSRYGIDSTRVFESVIERGQPPPVNARAYTPDYTLGEQIVHDFAPGFDVITSWREKAVRGVVPEGHAYEAGLRNGMELIDLDNSRQYDPEEPMRVTVRIDGAEETIEFFPKGAPMVIPLFELRPRGETRIQRRSGFHE